MKIKTTGGKRKSLKKQAIKGKKKPETTEVRVWEILFMVRDNVKKYKNKI